jgi:hypothetical protein
MHNIYELTLSSQQGNEQYCSVEYNVEIEFMFTDTATHLGTCL